MQKIWIASIPDTPLGPIWVGVTAHGLAAVTIGGEQSAFVRSLPSPGAWQAVEDERVTAPAAGQIADYLQGKRRTFDLPIDWSVMTPFQQRVLQLVVAIPYGQVSTYGEIARRVGKPGAARAVGRANATNPMPLVVPCHRLVGADGGLHGYGAPGGIQTKAWLLALEGQVAVRSRGENRS